MAERAVVALEGGERDAALVRLVAVMDQEARHATRLTAGARAATSGGHPDLAP